MEVENPFARMFRLILGWLARIRWTKKPRIEVRPPEQDWWYGGWFAPGESVLNNARANLRTYRDEIFPAQSDQYGQRVPFAWRYRYRPFSATGLPRYLRGWVGKPPDRTTPAAESATIWLNSSDVLTQALFGVKDWASFFPELPRTSVSHPRSSQDNSVDDVSFADPPAAGPRNGDEEPAVRAITTPRFHVRYQQWHPPEKDDPDADGPEVWPVFGGQICVHLREGDLRVSVDSSYLPVPPDKEYERRISEQEAWHIARLAMLHMVPRGCLAFLLRFLSRLVGWANPYDKWVARTHLYEGHDLVVLPFAGDYYLAYEIHVTSPDRAETWSVFVDAERGAVLGRPRNLGCHAYAYASSEEALSPPPEPTIKRTWDKNPCEEFMDIRIYDNTQPTYDRAVHWETTGTAGPEFEATNVAYHALQCYNYLVGLGADEAALHNDSPYLTARVATPDTGFLEMNFNYGTQLITFQHQESDQGLPVAEVNIPVYHPAHDPELVYHEVVHGLMWLLNPDPFEHQVEAAPFACSLLEGYANYFGRSLGIGLAAAPPEPWAHAAYRTGASEWGDQWALDRDSDTLSQDLLAVPNLYPKALATGLLVYDVGMIWARALWDLRQIVESGIADELALEASMYACGWVPNLEIVAEGLIDAADKCDTVRLDEALLPLLAARNLLAGQGIQALAATGGGIVFVGTDAGLVRTKAVGWSSPGDEEAQVGGITQPLTDVVALATYGNTVYAATKTGVYQGGTTNTEWEAVGTWPEGQWPLALAVGAGGEVYVGTGDGVWTVQDGGTAAASWAQVNPSAFGNTFSGLALDVAVGSNFLFVAGYNALWVRAFDSNAEWVLHKLQDEKTHLITCVEAVGERALVGTGHDGIWQYTPGAGGSPDIEPIAPPDGPLNHAAVLSLAVDPTAPLTVYAGTSKGIYKGDRAVSSGVWTWSWSQVSTNLPTDAIVTRLLWTTSGLYAGTAQHGLWKQNGVNWHLVTDVQEIAVADIKSVCDGVPAPFTVPAPVGGTVLEVCLHPFHLIQAGKIEISFCTAAPADVKLWSIGLNVHDVDRDTDVESQWITKEVQQPGFYAVAVKGASGYTATVSVKTGP